MQQIDNELYKLILLKLRTYKSGYVPWKSNIVWQKYSM